MKICVPTRDDRGLDAEVHGHVGGAPYYTIADTDGGTVQTVRRGDHGHGHGRDECGPGARIRSLEVDAVVCEDIGRRAMASLGAAGITVLVSDGKTVGAILAAARDGRLRALTADEVCAGHGARHGNCDTHAGHRRSHRHHRERPEGETS